MLVDLICVAYALVEIAEIRAEATTDEAPAAPAIAPVQAPKPVQTAAKGRNSRRSSVPMMVDMDPFDGAA